MKTYDLFFLTFAVQLCILVGGVLYTYDNFSHIIADWRKPVDAPDRVLWQGRHRFLAQNAFADETG